VDDHGGEIRLANNHGGEVSIWLPLARQDVVDGRLA
jgi:nitrogen fixation/metabolism regulation signal transduction histidine kinase